MHMTKMLQMYATKEFSNGCDLWLAGICRYLNDAYAPIASDLLGLMAEVSFIVCHYNHLHSCPLHPPPLLLPSHAFLHSLLPTPLSVDDHSLHGRLSSTHPDAGEGSTPLLPSYPEAALPLSATAGPKLTRNEGDRKLYHDHRVATPPGGGAWSS